MRMLARALALAGWISLPVAGFAQTRAADTTKMPEKPGNALAETTLNSAADTTKMPEKPGVPTLAAIMGAEGIDFNGYIDATYTNLSGKGVFTSGVANRVFDVERNSFNLQQVGLVVSKLPREGLGGLVNATFGKDADVVAAYDTNPNNGTGTGTKDNFDVTQAYVHYGFKPFMLIAGKYVTLSGAEVINSTANVNVSRSILFGYAIPFSHTGVRAIVPVNDSFSFIAGVNNGWDDLKDTNSQKTLELSASLTPNKSFSLAAQGYFGKEQVAGPLDPAGGQRNLIDVVATINATEKLTFVLNADYGTQKNFTSLVDGSIIKAEWQGIAGYANYQFHDQWRVSLRGEYFDDNDGYRTGVIQKWKEATLTLAYLPYKNVEFRAEARRDWSDVPSFVKSDGVSTSDTQTSFAAQAIFKF
ncbi:MAG: outer membrane beta-barrel protein [Pseudomonadota bacterium]